MITAGGESSVGAHPRAVDEAFLGKLRATTERYERRAGDRAKTERRLAEGVEMTQMGPGRIRAVTHMDVDRAGIERALEAFRAVVH